MANSFAGILCAGSSLTILDVGAGGGNDGDGIQCFSHIGKRCVLSTLMVMIVETAYGWANVDGYLMDMSLGCERLPFCALSLRLLTWSLAC